MRSIISLRLLILYLYTNLIVSNSHFHSFGDNSKAKCLEFCQSGDIQLVSRKQLDSRTDIIKSIRLLEQTKSISDSSDLINFQNLFYTYENNQHIQLLRHKQDV